MDILFKPKGKQGVERRVPSLESAFVQEGPRGKVVCTSVDLAGQLEWVVNESTRPLLNH